jgi:hypothetical protein
MVHFADVKSFVNSANIARPTCPKCGAPMWLTRIEPDEPGCARRTLECPRCQNRTSEIIELEKAYWLSARPA